MSDDTTRVVLSVFGDLRLVAGVASAVGHVAESAGLDRRALAELVAATEEACRQSWSLLRGEHPSLGVTIERFSDRIEVTIEHSGPNAEGNANVQARVDRVRYKAENGRARVILVKYLSGRAGLK